jgi:hypothetical protein
MNLAFRLFSEEKRVGEGKKEGSGKLWISYFIRVVLSAMMTQGNSELSFLSSKKNCFLGLWDISHGFTKGGAMLVMGEMRVMIIFNEGFSWTVVKLSLIVFIKNFKELQDTYNYNFPF